MLPYLIKIGSFEIRFYSLAILFGVFTSLYFINRKSKELGIDPKKSESIIIWSFIIGVLGARLYYVVLNWHWYSKNLMKIFAIYEGGLAIHGGVILGTITAFFMCSKSKIDFFKFADLSSPFLLFSQGIGRFGNFMNGEAHGFPTITPLSIIFRIKPVFNDYWLSLLSKFKVVNNGSGLSSFNDYLVNLNPPAVFNYQGENYILKPQVPWGISFSNKYLPQAYEEFGTFPVHPTFFYEMILDIIAFLFIIVLWKKNKNIGKGLIFGLYLICFGLIRGFVTFFRADDLMIGDFRAPHLVSMIIILLGVFWIKIGKKRILLLNKDNN